jgi:hypothetical protein
MKIQGFLSRLWITFLVLYFLGIILTPNSLKKVMAGNNPVSRTISSKAETTLYDWWLVYWSNNIVACDFYIEHEGNPTDQEIQEKCSAQLYESWFNSPSCENSANAYSKKCSGLYLHLANTTPFQKEVEIKFALPSVRLSMSGCEYQENRDFCTGNPSLIFNGLEPIPNEAVTRIHGIIGEKPFICTRNECTVALTTTDLDGSEIVFIADSSYGDSSAEYVAYARVIPVKNQPQSYFVDVISSQWDGKPPPACSNAWQTFPEDTSISDWLSTPVESAEMYSSSKLYFLSAALINQGIVDASACEDNGLATSKVANECGVAAAESVAEEWQNQFNDIILSNSQTNNIPALLMKRLIARESQFWPGVFPGEPNEVGLAQITENGADTLLLWNKAFYQDFCPSVFGPAGCIKGFSLLNEEKQAVLKGALLQSVNATCADCENGLDMDKADNAIYVLSELLNANCAQVGQLVWNITNKSPREVSTYTDLWRYTLADYNAGAGCLGDALTKTWGAKDPLNWQYVAANFDPACQGAVDYVVDVSNGNTEVIPVFSTTVPSVTATSSTSTITPTVTLTITVTPTMTVTPIPTVTSTPTITENPTE